jgi:O-antigen ligase
MPLVSFKFLLVKIWFFIAFYFLATQMFKKGKNINTFFWLYIIPLIIVIGYTVYNHSKFGLLDQEAANFVVNPFYNDHTSYGAMLAVFLPIIIYLLTSAKYQPLTKVFIWIVLIIFLSAIVLSYTRATWVSIFIALVIFSLILLKVRFKYVFAVSLIVVFVFFAYRTDILIYLEQNRQESSTNLTEHLQSVSNVTSDASNMERLNRWNCAIRMFEEKPVFGWGPGTYMFQYAPFQLLSEKTIISTNAGDMGNAHSEYLGPLAESGLLGSISFILIVVYLFYTAYRMYRKFKNNMEIKKLIIAMILGLATYFLHGFLNNFLDTDKASVPIWGFAAILVALDVYYKEDVSLKSEKLPETNKSQDQ